MQVTFWILFGVGSTLLVFGALLGQVPGDATAFEKLVLCAAVLLLGFALLIGKLPRATPHWQAGIISTVVLSFEILICLYGLVDAIVYHRR